MKTAKQKFDINIEAITAMTSDGVIGYGLKLPWAMGTQKTDMKFFREKTSGGIVVMGRKTFESMGGKPLPKRFNIVISNNTDFEDSEDLVLVRSVTEALKAAELYEAQRRTAEGPKDSPYTVYIIGGATVYAQCMDMGVISRFWVTYVNMYSRESDREEPVRFPRVFDVWAMEDIAEFEKSEKDAYSGSIKCMVNTSIIGSDGASPEDMHPIREDNGWIRMKDGHPAEYGEYEVYWAKCGKQHCRVWNNIGWAYDNESITHWRPKTPPTIM